jgi:hypothetical protein
VIAISWTTTVEWCEVFTAEVDRRADALTADEGATGDGRLLITMPVASPSVRTPVTTHETIART